MHRVAQGRRSLGQFVAQGFITKLHDCRVLACRAVFAQGCTDVHRVAVFLVYMAVFVGFKAYGFWLC